MSQDLTTLPTKHHTVTKVLILPAVLSSLSGIHNNKAPSTLRHGGKVLRGLIFPPEELGPLVM